MLDFQGEVERLLNVPDKPLNIGMFQIKRVNIAMKDAALMPNPRKLWLSLWFENECCCLFADANTGKSVYATQIATELAKTDKVCYFDFELSEKQFQLRYSDEQGNLFTFPENLYIVRINPDVYQASSDFEGAVMSDIEDIVKSMGFKIIIVDNLTWLCNSSEKGDSAGVLMQRLIGLKRTYGLSELIIAHTPKRPLCNPISQNDLAGSKKLMNFFDSSFAVGKSIKGENIRYVKQVKVRNCGCEYGADNVISCHLEKGSDNFTRFVSDGFSDESAHLIEPKHDRGSKIEQVKKMYAEGTTMKEISDTLHISIGSVSAYLKN